MSDHLDDRIRELFSEADLGSPEPPPVPRIEEATPRAPRWLIPAVGLATAAVVVALGLSVLQQGEAGDEATGTTSAGAAAEATTVATDAGGTATTTQEATETTEAMTATTEPGDPMIPLGDACVEFAGAAEVVLPNRPATVDDARAAMSELIDPMRVIVEASFDAAADTGDPELVELASLADNTIHQGMVDFVASPGSDMNDYDRLSAAVDDLGAGLALAGAPDCEELIGALP